MKKETIELIKKNKHRFTPNLYQFLMDFNKENEKENTLIS